jgi:hypothetical protein
MKGTLDFPWMRTLPRGKRAALETLWTEFRRMRGKGPGGVAVSCGHAAMMFGMAVEDSKG